ncbi:MAG: DUF2938 family protein [Pelagimonas sp.]|uniref:DUF2938 family protein n=1 Tax=Pelagimonas sp. TaxID=2073170 RepID=UPI003D6A724E
MDWIVLMATGLGATAFMDVVAWGKARLTGIFGLDYALVGRWIGHWGHGKFAHASIMTSARIQGEKPLGWGAHYLIGAGFALCLGLIVGIEVALVPSVWLHVGFGIATVAMPFLIMMPCFGFGFFASRTPTPPLARVRSLFAHFSYGIGHYVAVALAAYIL